MILTFPTSSLRDTIREATRRSHARLDAALSSVDLCRSDDYARFLRGQAEALLPLETALERHGIHDILPDWEQRRRTPAIEHDLSALDIDIDPLPVPDLASRGRDCAADLLGIAYVLEGSRMGARIILSRVAETPDGAIIGATAFLRHGFGKRFWPTFLATLENDPQARGQPVRVSAAAQMAFGMFECALIPTMRDTERTRADADRTVLA
jgi:heme oxygenase (biliverdin-IX-beta and delta-forming)